MCVRAYVRACVRACVRVHVIMCVDVYRSMCVFVCVYTHALARCFTEFKASACVYESGIKFGSSRVESVGSCLKTKQTKKKANNNKDCQARSTSVEKGNSPIRKDRQERQTDRNRETDRQTDRDTERAENVLL